MRAENGPASSVTRKTGPEKIAAAKQVASGVHPTGADVVPLPLSWARQLIAHAAGDVPEYGSPGWAGLPDDSREKVAACVLAAEAWRTRHHRADFLPPSLSSRARRIAEARRPRPGDHRGGPVQWDEVAGQ